MEAKLSRLIFNSISDGVFAVDRNCVITLFNNSAERITGFSRTDAVGKHCFDTFRTEVCHCQCALKETLRTHAAVRNARVTILTRDGRELPIQVTTTILKDDEVDPAMHKIIDLLPDIAGSECNVLIEGPSGCGKELFAQVIHNLSPRRYGPYIRMNCAALPATLLESDLFGYVKGAFNRCQKR